MEIFKIIIATIAGTSFMTAFSYLMSESFRKLFIEPILLNYVVRLSNFELNPKLSDTLGWMIHYGIGLVFVICYHIIWKEELLPLTILAGLGLGAASGIVGIISWMVLFSMPSDKPKIHFVQYYSQLFFAHIIFAVTVVLIYQLFSTV